VPGVLLDLSQVAMTAGGMNNALILPSVISLGVLFVEFALAAGLIWIAIWWLAQT
jgi:hypothetical protein